MTPIPKVLSIVIFLTVGAALSGQSPAADNSFQLKNADPDKLLCFWVLERSEPAGVKDILHDLPAGIRAQLAPGETKRLTLDPAHLLVGFFLPWKQDLTFLSPMTGGFVLAQETAAGKQVALTEAQFLTLNRGRQFQATLQEWGVSVPQFVLDGKINDWNKVPVLASFGPGFLPGNHPQMVQVAVRDQVLWLHVQMASAPAAEQAAASVVLHGDAFFLEAFVGGTDARVWLFPADGSTGRAVGSRQLSGADLEAWVPLDRLSESEKAGLLQGRWELRYLVENGAKTDNSFMTEFSLGELP